MNRLLVTPAFRLIVLLTLALTLIVALVALSSLKQWAAVTTTVGDTRAPLQRPWYTSFA